jgi:hypothetical protein
VGYVGHEGLPLGVEDGCRGGLGCDLVEAAGLLVGALVAELAELFLVISPCHVVFAPMPGTSLDLLFMRFPFLGRCLLPVFVSLLFLLVGDVLPCSCLEQGSSVLAEDLTLGLKRDHVGLPVLVDNIDGGAGGIGKVDDLLGTHVPSHFYAFGLELSGVDDGST